MVAGFHPNGDQVTESPTVPAKDPVGMPPTVTPEKEFALVALPNNVLSRKAVPLMSTLPVTGTAPARWHSKVQLSKPVIKTVRIVFDRVFMLLIFPLVAFFWWCCVCDSPFYPYVFQHTGCQAMHLLYNMLIVSDLKCNMPASCICKSTEIVKISDITH